MNLANLTVPGPTRTTISAPFWDAAADGRLLVQRCDDCRRWIFYPRAICPHCWSTALSWTAASGQAHLETWSTIHRPRHPGWEPAAPYTIGIVRLAEGPTMLTHLMLEPAAAQLGMALRVRFERVGETMLPCFEPAP